jgi:hypothetical protein
MARRGRKPGSRKTGGRKRDKPNRAKDLGDAIYFVYLWIPLASWSENCLRHTLRGVQRVSPLLTGATRCTSSQMKPFCLRLEWRDGEGSPVVAKPAAASEVNRTGLKTWGTPSILSICGSRSPAGPKIVCVTRCAACNTFHLF